MRISARRSLSAAALVGVIGAVIAGCGGSTGASRKPSPGATAATSPSTGSSSDPFAGETGDQIMATALKSMSAADSIELKGTVSEHGTRMAVDLTMGKGTTCKGSVALGARGTVHIVRIGPTAWLKVDGPLLNSAAQGAASSVLRGKYIKAPASDPKFKFTSFCDLTTFLQDGSGTGDTYSKGPITAVNGRRAVTLQDGTDNSTALVSLAAPHRVLRLNGPTAADGYLDFSYDVRGRIVAPPASETIDGTKYGL